MNLLTQLSDFVKIFNDLPILRNILKRVLGFAAVNEGSVFNLQTMTKLEDLFSPCQSPTSSSVEGEVDEDIKGGEHESLLSPLHSMFHKFKVACINGQEDRRSSEKARFLTIVSRTSLDTILGLPAGFRMDDPRKVKITSPKFFGVSVECMECSVDFRGNRVPNTLLLLQKRLYARGGLQTEGIFRISAAHCRQKYCRDQVNRGIVPEDVDVHCLAGIITAWFRELPRGILDPLLKPKQVMQIQSEQECDLLVRRLPPVEASLFDWAVNLMADVVQEVHRNKMTAHNIAVVFTPNMTRTEDPLTALENVAQMIKFLETVITKTMEERERGDSDVIRSAPPASHHRYSRSVPCMEEASYSLDLMKHGIKPEGAKGCEISDGKDPERKLSLQALIELESSGEKENNPNVRKKTRRVNSHVRSMQFMHKFL